MSTTIESAEPRSAKSSRVLENPPNARRTMEALRELGYDSYSSILDILDNCIDAHAAKIDIEIGEQKVDIVITIDDDGTGMDEETLSIRAETKCFAERVLVHSGTVIVDRDDDVAFLLPNFDVDLRGMRVDAVIEDVEDRRIAVVSQFAQRLHSSAGVWRIFQQAAGLCRARLCTFNSSTHIFSCLRWPKLPKDLV